MFMLRTSQNPQGADTWLEKVWGGVSVFRGGNCRKDSDWTREIRWTSFCLLSVAWSRED